MSTIKTTNITHGSNSGTENLVLASNGNVTVAGALAAGSFTGAGITGLDTWRLTVDTTSDASYITSNWARATGTLDASIGTAVSESSGVFTLPNTGIWWIRFSAEIYRNAGLRYIQAQIDGSTDGFASNTTILATGHDCLYPHNNLNAHGTVTAETFYDVTNTSNNKIKVSTKGDNDGTMESHADRNVTFIQFIRIGDT